MSTNTIEHPTWAETEYEAAKRRAERNEVITQLAAALTVVGLLLFGIICICNIETKLRQSRPRPVREMCPATKMYDLDPYFLIGETNGTVEVKAGGVNK